METKTVDLEVADHNEGMQGSCEYVAVVDSSGSISGSSGVRLSKVLISLFHRWLFKFSDV